MQPDLVREYHVFLASPSDMNLHRQEVRRFFEAFNRHTASRWNVQFSVVDFDNYASIGVDRPEELIKEQTLERFKDSLVLIIGLIGQRLGSLTSENDSNIEEEAVWALNRYAQTGVPEIKWYFRNIEKFEASSNDPDIIREELDQWIKVRAFRESFESASPPILYQSFSTVSDFTEVFREDLTRWLMDESRPWHLASEVVRKTSSVDRDLPDLATAYFESVITNFKTLDIAGIDNDRVVDIPLSEVYVRLRVIRDEDSATDGRRSGRRGAY